MLLSFAGIGASTLETAATANSGDQWNVVDTVSLTKGRHQLKFGLDYRQIRSPLTPFTSSAVAEYFSASAVLGNSATATVLQKFNQATPIFHELAVFAQDEYHVVPALTLSLGLRWELDPPPTEENGQDAYTVLGNIDQPATLTLAPQGTALWNTSRYNIAPRLGLAWTAHTRPGWETVLRGGGGVFFDTDNEVATDGYDGLGFRAFQVLFGNPLPVTPSQLNFSTAVTPPYATVYAFPPHLQLPYTLQWNASLEQALGKAQSLTLSYVGSNGRRLLQVQERSVASLNPAFTVIEFVQGGVTSNYQALQLKFQRSVTKGIQTLVSYSWSHSIDFGSNSSALPLTRGDSDYDVRHNLEGGLSWDLPGAKGNTFLQSLTSRWGVDGRLIVHTAFPITLQGGQIIDPATGNLFFGNVNLVAGKPLFLYSAAYPGGRALNPAAFATPAGSNFGNAPRNFVRGFGVAQGNVAVRRQFPLHEGVNLQFRAEAFNVFNHPNFGYVDPVLTDATFGQATKMLNQSLGTVSAQYQQGGPRSMQFALKLQF
jgi:TonB dependent receptor